MEETVRTIALHLSLIVEALAAVVIGLGLVKLFIQFFPSLFRKTHHIEITTLRVKFGSTLALSLELLLAADILRTAVAPTWEDIGKLAAIATIRTVLNYFLERELAIIEKRQQNHYTGATKDRGLRFVFLPLTVCCLLFTAGRKQALSPTAYCKPHVVIENSISKYATGFKCWWYSFPSALFVLQFTDGIGQVTDQLFELGNLTGTCNRCVFFFCIAANEKRSQRGRNITEDGIAKNGQ